MMANWPGSCKEAILVDVTTKMNTLVRGLKEQLLGEYGYSKGTSDEVMGEPNKN
ncbi:MAG: hypothetical protein JRJ41_09565 [Deltaproteobacteria bacterium]|nr:hypothetical protein [Deltaproteobacteria bacterium]